MMESEFKFWNKEVAKWQAYAAFWLEEMQDMEGFERCMKRVELSEMRRDEASGVGPIVWGPEIYA